MVLAQLGGSISRALAQMSNATVIDDKAFADCLHEIARALLQSDVQIRMVSDMRANIRRAVNLDALPAGTNKRRIIQQVSQICRDPSIDPSMS
jgi:signal recognition particle subunit SRP54